MEKSEFIKNVAIISYKMGAEGYYKTVKDTMDHMKVPIIDKKSLEEIFKIFQSIDINEEIEKLTKVNS